MSIKEEWRDIQGYEGLYQISNLGHVKSIERVVRSNKYGAVRVIPEKVLKPTDNGHGYKFVTLHQYQRRKNFYIHRLVATHFVENPKNLKFVNHKDFNKDNNMFVNLEWCTQKENVRYSAHRMCHPKNSKPPKTTGEKYIQYRFNRYRVLISQLGIDRSFRNLNEAISYRDSRLGEVNLNVRKNREYITG